MLARLAVVSVLVACRPAAPPPISAHANVDDVPGLFKEVRIACVHYTAPRGWYEGGIMQRTSVGLEVTTVFPTWDEHMLTRDYTPILAIGEHAATAAAWTAPNTVTWRFYDPSALAIGDPIRYGFPDSPRETGTVLSIDCRG